MGFKTKWRPLSRSDVAESPIFDTRPAAEDWAFKRISEGIEDIWIEDESGNIVSTYADLFPRLKDWSR